MVENSVGDPEAIRADDSVQEQEHDEVLVIMQADAWIHPDAMMVHFLAALVTQTAVLRPSRLGYLARVAPIDGTEE